MHTYLALLRGVNVGGKALLGMAQLKNALTASGLSDVRTYIQSGNVIFSSNITNTDKLAKLIQSVIEREYALNVGVAVFTKTEWQSIVHSAPGWWGKDKTWKHNLIIMLKPFNMQDVVAAIGTLKPDIEAIKAGDGVLYQSMSLKMFGRTTTGKLATKPVYKQMTIRNYNTATKLSSLLD